MGKPFAQLSGEDGNVYAIMGRVRRALRHSGQPDLACQFIKETQACTSYDEVLQLAFKYCDVG
jgi:hypothetical protein